MKITTEFELFDMNHETKIFAVNIDGHRIGSLAKTTALEWELEINEFGHYLEPAQFGIIAARELDARAKARTIVRGYAKSGHITV